MSVSPFIPAQARLAGLLYLVIIVAGVWGEGIARGGMTSAEAIREGAGLYRLAMGADMLMALCDAGVAVLLYLLLRPLAPAAALGAMVFRLIQTAVIAANMIVTAAALMLAGAGRPGVDVPAVPARPGRPARRRRDGAAGRRASRRAVPVLRNGQLRRKFRWALTIPPPSRLTAVGDRS